MRLRVMSFLLRSFICRATNTVARIQSNSLPQTILIWPRFLQSSRALRLIESMNLVPQITGRRRIMKRAILLIVGITILGLGSAYFFRDSAVFRGRAQEKQVTTIPDVITLGKDAKLGTITFNHGNHITKNYNLDGSGPVKCIECHHTAQPSSEVAKHPPMKTSWPADRTTTLTAELFTKDPAAAGVAACRSCHARTGEVPKLLPKIPEIKLEASTTLVTVNNQQAFHRTCAVCHTEVVKLRPAAKPPTTNQCMNCHKKTAV